jgi:hypothetical protein
MRDAAVVGELEGYIRPGERRSAEHLVAVGKLGGLGLEEFSSCRGIVIEIRHLDDGAGIERGRRDTAIDAVDAPGVGRTCSPAGDGGARHGRDRGQRLAPETHRVHAFEVVEAGDLAGGVAIERQRELLLRDAATVVADADAAHAALFELDLDGPRAGVECVLEHFLDDRGGALDDLAGGDLVDEDVRQRADRRHRGSSVKTRIIRASPPAPRGAHSGIIAAFERAWVRMESTSSPELSRRAFLALLAGLVVVGAGCSVPGTSPGSLSRRSSFGEHLFKTDVDHYIEASQRRIFVSLRRLAEKLYRRNPREWRKTAASLEEALVQIFDVDHAWRLASLDNRRNIEALTLAFTPEFRGDRVQALMVGMSSMIQSAFGDMVGFYVLNDLSPQGFYNAARNVEIAAWKLGTVRDGHGELLLLSNEMGEINNLSFEREMGRIIGILEALSDLLEIKTERMVIRVVQGVATAAFLPIP